MVKRFLFYFGFLWFGVFAQNVGIGTASPASKLSVNGGLSVGATYASTAAPTNGAIFEGYVGIGTTTPTTLLALSNGIGAPAGFTQGQVGGDYTLELTTADATGNQATRFLLRGNYDNANIEFYRGARGAEQMTVFIEGATGYLGIGTTTPDNRLDVNGKISVTQSAGNEMVIINDHIWQHFIGNQDLSTGSSPAEVPFIVASKEGVLEGSGIYGSNLWVTIWAPSTPLVRFVNTTQWGDGNTNPYDNNAEVAQIDGNGAYTNLSDINRKEAIQKIDGREALNIITQINGYTYKYKLSPKEIEKGKKQLTYSGVIAQEVEKVFPYVVRTNEYGDKLVHYDGFVGLFIAVIKEQQRLINQLQKRIEHLEQAQK